MSYQETNYITDQVVEVLREFAHYPTVAVGLINLFEKWHTPNQVWESEMLLLNLCLRQGIEYDSEYWEDHLALFAGMLSLASAKDWHSSVNHAKRILNLPHTQ